MVFPIRTYKTSTRMLREVCILLMIAAVVGGRTSPNVHVVEDILNSPKRSSVSDDILEDAELDVPGLIAKYGYPNEIHNVITSDGYILELHRIPYGRDNNNRNDRNKPVVFLMHGLLSSSADFVVLGPQNSLGYLLAEAGYDVWMGNARGNYYSRRHISLNPDSTFNQNFWRFSWDEIGNYDLSATIDYILEKTGQAKLHYIGHSQGGTAFLVLNSLRPDYNDKFISFQGLAPAAFFDNNENEMFNNLAQFESILETLATVMGIGEIYGQSDSMNMLCGEGSLVQSLCLPNAINFEAYNSVYAPVIKSNVPAGAAIRQVSHYGQSIRFKTFRRYNYNLLSNLSIYGRTTPPAYDLSKVTVPTYLHYGMDDNLVDHRDIQLLASKLPNVVGLFQVGKQTFDHFDFLWAEDVKEQLNDNVIAKMRDAELKL